MVSGKNEKTVAKNQERDMMEASKREATRKGVQNPTAQYLYRNPQRKCKNQNETQQSQHGVSSTE